ncbi:signal transduction histidine kinase [Catenuloplanes nepalensis]|uniref:histidine kinase n=1 Tax=Catenuloplanes nepalensis TaxID=587533 RepID=A0ABT9MLQ2_9ACTN|nr:histidine kinase [Catenuloplanes nepalensis]MDP9792352.1 signal transduction histidine kinase [Catenuloplanes nepalensis]
MLKLRALLADVALTGAAALLFAGSGTAVSVPLAIAQVGPLLLRRRLPAAVLIVVAAATAVHTTSGMARAIGFLPVTVAIFTAAAQRTVLTRWVLCPAAGLTVAAASAARHGLIEGFLLAVVMMVIAWLAGFERDEHLRLRLAAAASADRERLARRVHDTLAHTVTIMLLQTEALRATAPLGPDDRRRVDLVLTAGREALADVRAALADAEPSLDLPDRLALLRASGLRLPDRLPPSLTTDLSPPLRDLAARLIGEAATNALRHDGPGTRLTVAATRSGPALTIRIVSSGGRATPPPAGPGFGLKSLSKDISGYGGSLTYGPAGDTWEVVAVLPAGDGPGQ